VYGKTAQSRRQSKGLPVTDRAGRAIGRLIGRQYHKLVSRPDQILRSPPGFGFDVWAMDTYVLPRVDELLVEDRVNGRLYRSSSDNFIKHRLQINRGAGPQYVLPLVYWEAEEIKALRRVAETTAEVPPPAPSPAAQARLI
jgi:hypothetical protein